MAAADIEGLLLTSPIALEKCARIAVLQRAGKDVMAVVDSIVAAAQLCLQKQGVPDVVIANAGVKENSARELIARLKAQPEGLVASTSGVGSYSHLAGEWFAANAGVKIRFIPYATTSPYTDLIGGQVQLMFDALPAAIGNVKAGKLKVLALTGKTRHPQFPEVPTFAEAGITQYSPTAWIGLFLPAGTPRAIVDRLGEAMQKATAQNPALIEKWQSYGGELRAMSPDAFAAFLKEDNALWGGAIGRAGIKLE